MVGKKLGQYEIVASLGAGGMGDVYRARDTNLQRDVAVKVLPEAMADDDERLARLQREAHLLASVNHPNIAAIYNLEESGGIRWLVLEIVEGRTLEQELRDGPLPVRDCLRIARQVAGALEAAHEKGIVHRDLKSANVMLDEKGRVKVLDFGIAKDVSGGIGQPSSTDTDIATQADQMAANLTRTGMIVGTVPYMSPEQIRGKGVDARTDNWAFGCLLFELLTGRRPFDRETVADTLSAVLEHEPDWDRLPEDTPEAVQDLIRRCLQKDPSSRLHSIADARVELDEIEAMEKVITVGAGRAGGFGAAVSPGARLVATGVALLLLVGAVGWGLWSSLETESSGDPTAAPVEAIALDPNAVAVLLFEYFGPPEDEHRSDSTARAIQLELAKVASLTVPTWTSSSKVARALAPLEIGRALGVSKYVEGTVRASGNDQRVDVRLIDAASGEPLWRGQYNQSWDELETILDLEEEVALQVVDALELELSGDEEARLRLRPTANLAAYGAYLRGLDAFPLRTAEGLSEALENFEDAVSLDPDFAAAHVGVAITHMLMASYRGVDGRLARENAERSARRALALDPDIARAHAILGAMALRRGEPDWTDHFERAIQFSPNDELIHTFYGNQIWLVSGAGATPKAWEVWGRAAELGPLEPWPHENLGWLFFTEGRFDEAVNKMSDAVTLSPEYALGHMGLGVALHYAGRPEEAIDELRVGLRLNPADSVRHNANLGIAYASIGRKEEAAATLKARVAVDPNTPRLYLDVGDVSLQFLGDLDEAASWYQQALDLRRHPEALTGQVAVALDRGDLETASERLAAAEEAFPNNRFTRYARLDLHVNQGRYTEAAAGAREIVERPAISRPPYGGNWAIYDRQQPVEPLGYVGVLGDDPESSRRFFEVNFPDLFGDDPPIHAFTLKAAIDLAAVLMHTGETSRAELLLENSEAYLDRLPEAQRRHQFRTAPMHVYALQGRADEAFEAMEQAFDDGWRSGWWRLEHKPHFDAIRDDERFPAMIERLRTATSR